MSNWRVKEQLLPKKKKIRDCGKNKTTGGGLAPLPKRICFLDQADTWSLHQFFAQHPPLQAHFSKN